MSIGLRDITQLEEITEIPDDAEVIVITNGVAKKISKENAKFSSGGGGATIFYCQTSTDRNNGGD